MNNTKVNQKIKSLIEVYCKDTTNIQSHLDLAKAYYDIKQYASAVTYLNRIAEMSDDSDIIYESLCLASECFSEQRNRTIHVKVCLYHAISVLPDRPEAYFLLSKLMEIEEPFQCYSYCVIAQCHKDNAKRVTDLPFEYDYYKLLFQKAVNAWHAQKVDECKTILYDLYIKYPMDKFYKELVVGNLNQAGWPEISNTVKSDLPKKVGIDIGACIGETLHQFEDFDIVYAIEPAEEEFKILKEKYKNDKRIIPIQCAISDKNGEDILNCYENGRFSSMLEFNKDTKFYKYCEDTCESFDNLKEKIKAYQILMQL